MRKISKLLLFSSVFICSQLLNLNVAAASSSSDISSNLQLDEQPRVDDSITWDIVMVILALAFVIFLLYYTVKFLSNRNRSFLAPKGIRSLGGIGVGTNSSVQVLYIGNKIYIVGVGQQVTLLDKESDPEEVQMIIDSFEAKDKQTLPSIKDFISSFNRKKKDDEQFNWISEDESNSQSFENFLQEKLEKQAERKQQLESLLKDKKE